MARNYFKSYKQGLEAESRFFDLAEKRGFSVKKLNKSSDDYKKHIDCFLVGKDSTKSVDIKSLKRSSRSDENTNDFKIWLEFRNVRGDAGWMNGEADLIAFESVDGFNLFDRKELLTWCIKNINFKEKVNNPRQAYLKSYTRDGRKDVITFVMLKDIENLIKFKI